MSDKREIKFVPYHKTGANGGTVFFGDETLGWVTPCDNDLYAPVGHRNPRTLYRCALTLAANNAARLEKQYRAAERLVSAIAELRDPAKEPKS